MDNFVKETILPITGQEKKSLAKTAIFTAIFIIIFESFASYMLIVLFPESFERRPVCFVGVAAGIWGALRPVEQLQAIFGYRNALVYPERVFLPRIHELLTEAGRLRDAELIERLRSQATGFIEFVEKLKGVKLRQS